MSEHTEMNRRFLARKGTWINLASVAAFVLGVGQVQRWRAAQFEGYGLKGTYYEGQDWDGKVFRTSVDPSIDFSDARDPFFKRGTFSAEWTGTLLLPRPGRYSFATRSDDGSTLELDGQMVVNNSGMHSLQERSGVKILDEGPHAIRIRYFQAGVGSVLRVFWSPAGRRGGLEYIPATLLRPVPPDQAKSLVFYAIPPRDWPAMAMILLGLLALTLLLGRGPLLRWLGELRTRPEARRDLALFLLLFGLALAVRLWDLHAAGRTWDEDVYWTAGRNFVQNLLGGDLRAESWEWNNEHPGLAKWLYGPATLMAESFHASRTVSALLGALTCALLLLAGRDLINLRVGVLGAALAAVLPHIVAHHKIIGLETPTGLFYLLTVWFFFRSVRGQGNSGLHLAAGASAGLLMATRVSNLSVLLVMGLLYLVVHRRTILGEGRFPVPVTLGLMPLALAAAFFVVWPYLWENPMKHLGEMLAHWDPDKYLEWYLGTKRRPDGIYFPLYFSVTTPMAVLGAMALYLGRASSRAGRDLGHLTLIVWFCAPFVVMLSPLARDGVRYLYPALFPACLMAAAGLDWLMGVLARRLLRRPSLTLALYSPAGAFLWLYTLYCSSTVHPYYLDYYNERTGGPAEVAKHHTFEIGWWGEGLKEACDFVGRVARRGATVWAYVHPTHVLQLRPDLQRVDSADAADFVLFNDLFNSRPSMPKHHIVYVVRAGGAPLVWIYEREGAEAGTQAGAINQERDP